MCVGGESSGIRLSSVQKVENLDPVGYPINHAVVGMDNNFPGAGDPAEAIKARGDVEGPR